MSFVDQNPTQRISLHPWKESLPEMIRMLRGETLLPHINVRPVNYVSTYHVKSSCEDCLLAFKQRTEYKQQTTEFFKPTIILSKE